MITTYYWDEETETEVKLDHEISVEPRPSQEALDAITTLVNSEWFGQENESANYHSLKSWLIELQKYGIKELTLEQHG